MAYQSWSVVFGEQPSASKWNILGTNDSYFSTYIDRSGFPVQIVGTSTSAVATGTTTIPADDTIPQNTEGTEFMSQAITPTSASNLLVIEATVLTGHTAAVAHIVALFQDTTANALAAVEHFQSQTNGATTTNLRHTMTAGTTSSTTFKIRAGGSSAGTMTFNGVSGSRRYGAITKSAMRITEYKV